ncbi:alkaline phosphatase D family protein [Pleomorphovibrio marinus]|uniref:alkaline phosphatase D family protein n=1 Tax=Pleomorphovibrio marinus TaxID=2164132 RepID=UPI0018E53094|nr:alkaline phosphatase D family protein [Pleomorphovibrio marinus]
MKLSLLKGVFLLSCILLFSNCDSKEQEEWDTHLHYLMAGEPMQESILLQARLAASDTIIYEDIHDPALFMSTDLEGKEGKIKFEIGTDPQFRDALSSPWILALPENDFIAKYKATGLSPGTTYYYRVTYGPEEDVHRPSRVQNFSTLPAKDSETEVSFVMVTGSHLARFYLGGGFGKASSQGTEAYRGEDKYEGFHGFESILAKQPDFFIGNGDNVYYDHPDNYQVKTLQEMRAMWHRQFFMPRIRKMFAEIPIFWMKDDHDHRFDDSDTTAVHPRFGANPSNELGIKTFLEQVPVVDPEEEDPITYRTVRVNKHLQLWMVEGRDYRSPNEWPDGPDKTIWGEEQKQWLKNTLSESDATYKILVTPTPMIGPDGAGKKDNHTNPDGFLTEGMDFFNWLVANDFDRESFFIITGDRHWQYHSIHPTGFQEFSCGAMVDQNSRLGVDPGTQNSNDPDGLIIQPYTSVEPSGGFLRVKVGAGSDGPSISFDFFDEYGEGLYSYSGQGN